MPDVDSDVAQIDYRIAAIRENLRELIERAAASCGAADEERISQRIADQQELLEALTKQREELSNKLLATRQPFATDNDSTKPLKRLS
jgi:flagellar hook-length control protein FliK